MYSIKHTTFAMCSRNTDDNRIKNKFMKAIYAKDIKAMVKQFDLNEAESDYLNDIAEAINKERTDLCEDIQMTLLTALTQSQRETQSERCLFTLAQRHRKRMSYTGNLIEPVGKLQRC